MGNFITIIIWIAIVYAIMKRAKKSSKPKAETPYENTSAKKQETVVSQRLKEKYAPKPKKKAPIISGIVEGTRIETDFVCSEMHRAFFKEHIGNSFSFNVAFQKWLKSNAGKTYKEAIAAYYDILEEKKRGKTKIDKQFEYNTYIRDFFADNHTYVF